MQNWCLNTFPLAYIRCDMRFRSNSCIEKSSWAVGMRQGLDSICYLGAKGTAAATVPRPFSSSPTPVKKGKKCCGIIEDDQDSDD